MPYEPYWWGPMWFFPIVMPVVMVVALVLCLYFFFSRGAPRPPWEPGSGREPETALDILKKRYAKGELTKEQFEQMKRDLKD